MSLVRWVQLKRDSLILALGIIGFGVLSVLLGRDFHYDTLNYHFYNGYAFVNGRLAQDLMPAQLQTFFNPLLDAPFYLMVTHLPSKAVGFILGGIHGINFFLVYLLMKEFLNLSSIRFSLLLAFCAASALSAMGFSILGTTTNDAIISIPVLLSFYFYLRSMRPKARSIKPLIVSGLLMGMALAFKLTIVVFVFGLLGTLLFDRWKKQITWSGVGVWGMSLVLGWAITGGWWALYLWNEYGNPFFPFFNNVFKSPLLKPEPWADVCYPVDSLERALFFPFYYLSTDNTMGCPWKLREFRYAIFYVLVFIWGYRKFKYRKPSDVQLNRLILFIGISYLAWLWKVALPRYFYPAAMLMPLGIVLMLKESFQISKQKVLLGLAILLPLAQVSPDLGRRPYEGRTYFQIRKQKLDFLEKEKEGLVLMVHDEAMSYLIPFLPKDFRYVSAVNNLTRTNDGTGIRNLIRQEIEEHPGPLFVMLPYLHKDYREFLETDWGPYKIDREKCGDIWSAAAPDRGVKICQIEKIAKETKP